MPKKVLIGIVKSDKSDKTRRVEIPRLVRHPLYGKFLRKQTVCYVHDEENASGEGDVVEIIESRRRSKTKRWDLVRIVEKSTEVDVVALRAAQRQREMEKDQGFDDGSISRVEEETPAKTEAEAPVEEVATEEVATEEVATEEVATEEVAAEEVATEEVAAEEVATEEVATEEVATEEVATEEVATEEVAGSDEEKE
jgi:small subunit ribosomal protein S17